MSGEEGNLQVKIRRQPRYVDIEKCTGCGDCGAVVLDEKKPPKMIYDELLVDRILIDEAKCVHCGDCVIACMEENSEAQGLTSIVKQRFHAVLAEQDIERPTLLQKVLQMKPDELELFWKEQFQKCIKCYGCLDECPVYVKEFAEFDISKWVPRGEVPPPYPLFHLLRAYQVWDTCVGCGECERTCPSHIPLKSIQDMIMYLPAEKVFELIPGLNQEAQDKILVLVEKNKASSRRLLYAV